MTSRRTRHLTDPIDPADPTEPPQPADDAAGTSAPADGDGGQVGVWPTTRPTALAAELRWVHDMLRRDLLIVQGLASSVSAGASITDVRAELRGLETHGPLFQLRANCLTLCQIIDSHHHGEDAALFPAVRRAAPELAVTIDRLEEDHRAVASLVADVGRLADGVDRPDVRSELVSALQALSTTLLDHLDYEERTLQPVLESWTTWPGAS